jgi:hypothetical protein
MDIVKRVKGLILAPATEWGIIEAEGRSIASLYRDYIVLLALIPPVASFLGGYFFGFAHAPSDVTHLPFWGGLLRAALQYALSLPMIYLVAFVVSSIAPHFEGEANDTRALTLVAYSYTPAWIAAIFGLVPGLRWLDILGLYGIYVFYFGLPRMMKCPKDHGDVFTLAVLLVSIAAGALHGWIVHRLVPWASLAG